MTEETKQKVENLQQPEQELTPEEAEAAQGGVSPNAFLLLGNKPGAGVQDLLGQVGQAQKDGAGGFFSGIGNLRVGNDPGAGGPPRDALPPK
jgi:hypothetical protein